jgi:hypothetical protein
MTEELKELCNKYRKIFDDSDPCGYMELEYGQEDYTDFIADIKTAMDKKVELPSLYPPLEGEEYKEKPPLTELQKRFKEEYEKIHTSKDE